MIPPDDGVYADISDTDYHSDRDSLSSSGARTLLWSSPRKFHEEQQSPPVTTPTFDLGHALHTLALGKGPEIVVVDAKSWQAGAAAEARKHAHAAGNTPILTKEYETAKTMARNIREHPIAGKLLDPDNCDAEVSGWWTDPLTGIRLRWRPDGIHHGKSRKILVDVKSSKDASPAGFPKSIAEYHYHQQQAWYIDGAIANGLDPNPLFVFIAVDKSAPYDVAVHECEPADVDRGRALNRKAIDIYAECRATNEWPGYPAVIHTAEFPSYARYREEAALA